MTNEVWSSCVALFVLKLERKRLGNTLHAAYMLPFRLDLFCALGSLARLSVSRMGKISAVTTSNKLWDFHFGRLLEGQELLQWIRGIRCLCWIDGVVTAGGSQKEVGPEAGA